MVNQKISLLSSPNHNSNVDQKLITSESLKEISNIINR